MTSLRDWLVQEMLAIGEAVDLVGHDIGGSTVLTIAMHHPDLLRTWSRDSVGVFDPDYVWHDLIAEALEALDATLTGLYGVGPVNAATSLGEVADIRPLPHPTRLRRRQRHRRHPGLLRTDQTVSTISGTGPSAG